MVPRVVSGASRVGPFFLFLLQQHEANCVGIDLGWMSEKRPCVIAHWEATSDKPLETSLPRGTGIRPGGEVSALDR